MGFVIVRKRVTIANIRSPEGWAADENIPHQRWCIDKIWIYQPHRRKGIASSTLHAIARYLGESARNLAWLCPLTDEGAALAHAVSGDSLYLAG